MSDTTRPAKRPKGRSPAYPAVSLEKAVQRATQMYKVERQYPVHVQTLAQMWGYTSLNGPASLTLSALIKFGLVEDEGSKDERTARVTDLAVQIIDHPSSEARQEAIQHAAMLPPIHKEMWEEYGPDLPSDANLLWRLTRQRGFTETGAKEFVREWRETMQYAHLRDAPVQTAVEPEEHPDEPDDPKPLGEMTMAELAQQPDYEEKMARGAQLYEQIVSRPAQSHEASSRTEARSDTYAAADRLQSYPIPIALSGRPPVQLTGAFPLSEAEWNQFMAVVTAMKPVLVGVPTPSPDTASNAES